MPIFEKAPRYFSIRKMMIKTNPAEQQCKTPKMHEAKVTSRKSENAPKIATYVTILDTKESSMYHPTRSACTRKLTRSTSQISPEEDLSGHIYNGMNQRPLMIDICRLSKLLLGASHLTRIFEPLLSHKEKPCLNSHKHKSQHKYELTVLQADKKTEQSFTW